MMKLAFVLLAALTISAPVFAQQVNEDQEISADAKWGKHDGNEDWRKDKDKKDRELRKDRKHKKDKWNDNDNGENCHPGDGHGHHGHHKPKKKKKKEHRTVYTCRAVDANHVIFSWTSGRDRDYLARYVLNKCANRSSVPRTCRLLGCSTN